MAKLYWDKLSGRCGEYHIASTRVRDGEVTLDHTHDFSEFFLITRGVGRHCWNGRKGALAGGSLVYMKPSDRHHFVGEDAMEFINLAVSPSWWKAYAQLFRPPLALEKQAGGTPAGHVMLSPSETPLMERRLIRLMGDEGRDPALLPGIVSSLVGWLLQKKNDAPEAEECPDWLARLIEEMRDPQAVAEPLAYWQKKSGRSPEHLARSCRRYLGASLTELLNRARMESVKAGLLRGDDKVISLAYDAGYQNLGYFYRTFRKIEGCTPKEWLESRTDREVVPRGRQA